MGKARFEPLPNINVILSPTDQQGHQGPRRVMSQTNEAELSTKYVFSASEQHENEIRAIC